MAAAHAPATSPVAEQNALMKQYCVGCHSDRGKAGGLTLASFDAASGHRARRRRREDDPQAARRHDAAGRREAARRRRRSTALATALETRIDRAAALNPNPGRRPFQRLNRAEYAARGPRPARPRRRRHRAPAARHDQPRLRQHRRRRRAFSPTVLEGYLRAASADQPLAVGDPTAAPTEATYKVPRTASQMRHVEGAPFGTRGGISVVAHLPGRRRLHVPDDAALDPDRAAVRQHASRGEQIEVSINGERVALLDINRG